MGMNNVDRAKQFLPFAALKGFEKAIYEQKILREEPIMLGEDAQAELDLKLQRLKKGDIIEIEHYSQGRYITSSGTVNKIDLVRRLIVLGGISIALDDIIDVGECTV